MNWTTTLNPLADYISTILYITVWAYVLFHYRNNINMAKSAHKDSPFPETQKAYQEPGKKPPEW